MTKMFEIEKEKHTWVDTLQWRNETGSYTI